MTIACNQVGAYVVDAVPDDQRAEFHRHLAGCDHCQAEVSEFTETVAALASTVATTPPPELRASVLGSIARVRPLPPVEPAPQQPSSNVVDLDQRRTGRRGFLRWGVAAASVGVVGLGAAGSISGWRTANSRAEALAAQKELLAAPDAKLIPVELNNGGQGSYLLSRQHNRAMFVTEGMPRLPAGKVFQQWILVGARPIRDVIFGHTDEPVWLTGDVAGADNFAVTIENDGGANTPDMRNFVVDPVAV